MYIKFYEYFLIESFSQSAGRRKAYNEETGNDVSITTVNCQFI